MSNHDQYNVGPPPPDGDKNYGGALIGINWAVFIPANLFVGLRIYTRLRVSHNIGWDDGMIVLAQAINCVGMGFVMLEIHYGLGRHKYFIEPDHYTGFLKYNFLDWNQVFITLCLSKIAICMFLLRISKFAKWRNTLYGIIAFLVFSHLPLELLFLFQCTPVNKIWDLSLPGHCFSLYTVEKIIIVQGVFSILSDVVLAAFPVLLLWNMRLPKRQKIQLNCLLGLGIVTALACIVRTAFSYEIKQPDVTWQGVPNAICRMVEINTGITAACMPMMRTLFISIKKRLAQRQSERLSSTRTAASDLQFYTPPTQTPWYLRLKRDLWRAPPTMEMAPNMKEYPSDRSLPQSDINLEKPLRPQLRPRRSTPKAAPTSSPARIIRERSPRPENATWAKEEDLSKNHSIDLPIQGPRKKGWDITDEEKQGSGGEEDSRAFQAYKYHRHWV